VRADGLPAGDVGDFMVVFGGNCGENKCLLAEKLLSILLAGLAVGLLAEDTSLCVYSYIDSLI